MREHDIITSPMRGPVYLTLEDWARIDEAVTKQTKHRMPFTRALAAAGLQVTTHTGSILGRNKPIAFDTRHAEYEVKDEKGMAVLKSSPIPVTFSDAHCGRMGQGFGMMKDWHRVIQLVAPQWPVAIQWDHRDIRVVAAVAVIIKSHEGRGCGIALDGVVGC